MELNALVTQLATLAGVGALIAALVNVGKTIGLVKDGQAQMYSTGLNLAALVGLFAIKVVAPEFDLSSADATAATIAQLALLVLGLVTQLGGAQWAHKVLSGLPLIGKSYSG